MGGVTPSPPGCVGLLQVLYFLPMMRAYLLQHVPDPDHEFSLTCEAAFLFRMLLSGPLHCAGATCQAANLLRSLRQIREASMLGLLEGHRNESSMKGSRGDIEARLPCLAAPLTPSVPPSPSRQAS